jgi:hypothetical protein
VEHLGRALPQEDEPAGVDLPDRVERELDRGDDTEVAAAAQRPEEVGVVLVVGARGSRMAVMASLLLRERSISRSERCRATAIARIGPACLSRCG